MNVETIIIIFVFLIILATTPSSMYPLIAVGGFLAACMYRKQTSRFADGDADDMKIGDTLAQDGQLLSMEAATHDLDSSSDIDAILSSPKYDGDELLKNQMRHVGEQAQNAIIARSRFTSDNFKSLYQEELDAGEERDWWEDDNLASHSVKDGQNWESDAWI